ncbi:hypothetical protein [Megasphaera elsdenii]|uniref:hypothetical protein n=1 Tax=Megasphaera elsdenii TaxID=907 RepID=UPI002432C1E1|nr:hypothetical protein [Megasphaera elsdenii]
MKLSKIIDYAKALGYDDAEFETHRNGGDIYLLQNKDDGLIEGMPNYIFVKDDTISLMDPDEALSYFLGIEAV